LSPIYDARDDIFNPTQGLFVRGELGAALKALGSEVEFLRSLFSGSYQQPLFGRTVWISTLRLGLMGWPGSDRYIPLSERFYAGGPNTVRGFPYDRLGPLDPKTGLPLGGEALVILNQELRFPLYGDLGASLFIDVGNVFLTVDTMFDDFNLRRTAGVGLHYHTPVGPVRMEYGWVLDREEGEGIGEFYLSIGNSF
jgi:outer membrane protein assembly factor BamA